jgi:hypothetical protein
MKISELIEELTKIEEEYGDLVVEYHSGSNGFVTPYYIQAYDDIGWTPEDVKFSGECTIVALH